MLLVSSVEFLESFARKIIVKLVFLKNSKFLKKISSKIFTSIFTFRQDGC